MSMSAIDIERVLGEITPVLLHGRIQKIHQPGDRILVLAIRSPGETHRLLVSCEPETARLHVSFHPAPNPARPPSFCQFLRAQFQGGRLEDIRQLDQGRIVTFLVSTRHGPRTLVCALTPPGTNILVLDERGHILRDLNGQRHIAGQPYQPPPERGDASAQERRRAVALPAVDEPFPLSRAIEARYHDKERTITESRSKSQRLRALRKSLAKSLRRIEALRQDLAKATAYRDYARYGELLKAHLQSVTPGMEAITLVDYYDPALPEVTLPLDRAKSALANMSDYFKKHRKYLSAERELPPRIARAEQDVDAMRREITSIDEGTWTAPLATGGALSKSDITRGTSNENRRGPFRRFRSADGLPIFVGRNAQENEELTFGLAKGDDVWLHARGSPGSHVIVRLGKGRDLPPETLQDAATLALLYSDLKKSGKGDVIHTRRKWVKKAKGQARGAVIVTQEKTISVKLDAQRLAALKERQV